MQIKTIPRRLEWEHLDDRDRKIIMAVCFDGSPKKAQKNLRIPPSQFNKYWRYLESAFSDDLMTKFRESLRKVLPKPQ